MHESDRDRATQEEKRKTPRKKEKIDMKAKELMLGDLVTFRESLEEKQIIPIKIVVLREDNNDFLAQVCGDEICDELEFNDEIVGIPITSDILKKIGFRTLLHDRDVYYFSTDYFEIFIDEYSDSIWRVMYNNLEVNIFARKELIGFVHELQHVFRLWGIEIDIKL